MANWIVVAGLLLLAHETAHAAAAWVLGGRVRGVAARRWAIGLAIDVGGIAATHRHWTLWAGPGVEAITMAVALIAVRLGYLGPRWALPVAVVGALDLGLNLVPWWRHNDGARLWRAYGHP